MATKEISTQLSPEEQAYWEANKPQQQGFTAYNRIFVGNKKMTEDGSAINPDFGKLFAQKGEEVTEIDIAKAEFKNILNRVQVMPKNDNADYYCEEADELSFIKIFDKSTKKEMDAGNYFDLFKKYELKSVEILYVQYGEDFYRWKLAFGDWQIVKDFLTKIRKSGKPTTFKIGSIKPTQNGANWFNTLEPVITGEYPISEAIGYIKAVKEFLADYYEGKKSEVATVYASPEEYVQVQVQAKAEQTQLVKTNPVPF